VQYETQSKVHADPDVASGFKAACAAAGISMACKLTQFMVEYSNRAIKCTTTPDYSTRRQRRAAVQYFVQQLGLIKEAEERVRDNTPENLQGSSAYEKTEEYVSLLDEIVDQLASVY
jgi:hypothetical protein